MLLNSLGVFRDYSCTSQGCLPPTGWLTKGTFYSLPPQERLRNQGILHLT